MSDKILELMKTRRSVRKYKSEMIPEETINKIIEAGTYAASGRGKQSPIILEITDKTTRDELAKMNAKIMGQDESFDPFYGAPVVLVILAPKDVPTYIYDGSLVIGNMMLAAHSLGIGSCWIHRAKEEFETAEGKAILKKAGIEGDYEGIGHCILGYADSENDNIIPRKDGRVFYIK